MSKLLKQSIILPIIISLLSVSTTFTAIAQPSKPVETTSEHSNTVAAIIKQRQEIKNYESSCKDSKTLEAVKQFRTFQTRLEYFSYYQYLNELSYLKLAVNELNDLKFDHSCNMLRFALNSSYLSYETIGIYLKLSITRNLSIVDSKSEIAQGMRVFYPDIPIKTINGSQYVAIRDLLSYLVAVAYL